MNILTDEGNVSIAWPVSRRKERQLKTRGQYQTGYATYDPMPEQVPIPRTSRVASTPE